MTIKPTTPQSLKPPSSGTVIADLGPSYAAFRNLPETFRWKVYVSAKAFREALESQGIVMSEAYDDFVQRVSQELGL